MDYEFDGYCREDFGDFGDESFLSPDQFALEISEYEDPFFREADADWQSASADFWEERMGWG